MRLSTRIVLTIATAALASIAVTVLALRYTQGWIAIAIIAVTVLLVIAWSARIVISRLNELHAVLGNALAAFRDGDFSLRLAARGDRELAELKRLYNELVDAVRDDRQDIYEKEILLDTILQRTPVAVVLLNAASRVIYSNVAARELLSAGSRLDGRPFDEIIASVDVSLREALAAGDDAIFHTGEETFHLTQRVFRL
ncbi:MAG: ATP-binding protein, partial [Thermoanaerobaculia bacterium]